MPSSPFLLALGSALCLFLYDLKAVGALSVPWVLFLSSLTSTMLLSLLILISVFAQPQEASSPFSLAHGACGLSAVDHVWILGKAFWVASSWFFTYSALERLPLSPASPLRATAPLFTLLGSMICFSEPPTVLQFGGITCILAATVSLLSRKDKGGTSAPIGSLLLCGACLPKGTARWSNVIPASDRPSEPDEESLSKELSDRTQTGVRPKVPSRPEESPAGGLQPTGSVKVEGPGGVPSPSGTATRSDPPESLQKPFAVLTSQRPQESDSERPQRTRSVPPRPMTIGERRRVDSSSARARGAICPKHQISLSPSGECLLCKKEAPAKSSRSLLRVALVSMLAGGTILLLIYVALAI